MLADVLRQFWLPGIHVVPLGPQSRLADWISTGQYYFDGLVGPETATFVITPGAGLGDIFAGEVLRFASAAFETATQVEQHRAHPRSLAWLIIQSYYSAYFAAHSLIRTTGVACTQFDGKTCSKIAEIADALGMKGAPLTAGSYRCEYNPASGRMEATRPGNKGVHEDFWRVFASFIRRSSDLIISTGTLPVQAAQVASSQLDDLVSVLVLHGCNGGNWLSMVRNQVNYGHKLGTWFPDWPNKSSCDTLFTIQKRWRSDPERIGMTNSDDMKRFLGACSFIVALCRTTILEMERRSPSQRSLLASMAHRFLRPV